MNKCVSNYRVLQATEQWHPVYMSMWRFLKSISILMHQHACREDFEYKLPKVAEALHNIESQCGFAMRYIRRADESAGSVEQQRIDQE